jgi:hypothetical protein
MRYARQAAAAGSARTYVIVDAQKERVVGYYALTAAGLDREGATARVIRGMPKYPIPVVLLARLAVDRSVVGRGLGAWLLRRRRSASGPCSSTQSMRMPTRSIAATAWNPRPPTDYT